MIRTVLALPFLVAVAGCGGRAAAMPAAEAAPAVVPVPVVQAAVPAPPAEAAAISERYEQTSGGWRAVFALDLPALPSAKARSLRRASEAWLFEGLIRPRGDFAASAAEAHRVLAGDNPHAGAEPWSCERAVAVRLHGAGWLALERTIHESASGVVRRSDGLLIEVAAARALSIDEVVPIDRQGPLRALLGQELRRQRGLPPGAALGGEVARDEDLPLPVPLLTADGAVFSWNDAELAPGSAGPVRVVLPRDAVAGLLARNPWRKP